MTAIFAIDPGPRQSGYCLWDAHTGILESGKVDNAEILKKLFDKCLNIEKVLIEKITLYQRASQDIHDTILWCGRFVQRLEQIGFDNYQLVTRTDVKKTLLSELPTKERNDSTIKAYLKDRFAPGVSNHGKGTKKEPGYFYGVAKDAWQAIALAVAWHDLQMQR